MNAQNNSRRPTQVVFDATPEIFATDATGSFSFELAVDGSAGIDTRSFDEIRFLFSVWHPAPNQAIDLDRAYMELRALFSADENHWMKLAEIEPVVPAYDAGDSFDGWIVLPVMSLHSAFAVFGSGFEPRARLQIRASAYLVD